MVTKTLNPRGRTFKLASSQMESNVSENGPSVDSCDTGEITAQKFTGLEAFSKQSACLSWTGAKPGRVHRDNSFLSLVTSALRLKGIT